MSEELRTQSPFRYGDNLNSLQDWNSLLVVPSLQTLRVLSRHWSRLLIHFVSRELTCVMQQTNLDSGYCVRGTDTRIWHERQLSCKCSLSKFCFVMWFLFLCIEYGTLTVAVIPLRSYNYNTKRVFVFRERWKLYCALLERHSTLSRHLHWLQTANGFLYNANSRVFYCILRVWTCSAGTTYTSDHPPCITLFSCFITFLKLRS